MKRILIFLLALLLLLTACTQKPSDPTLQETTPQETTPNVTTPENTTPEVTTPPEPPHEHLFGEATVTKEPTCVQNGTRVAYCSCGESEKTEIPATGRHRYVDNVCEMCQKTELLLIPVSSNYDADGDGEKDVYYFATEPAQRCASGTWIWAGNYDSNLSQNVSKSSAADIDHWYVEANSTNELVYRISVSESGVYEMILHMRLKDGNERGAKYSFNEGTAIEQVFQTSHAFDSETLKQAQNETVGTYMYGIYVYLQSGENIFSIECASQSSKTQHFREFFFVKDQAEHSHNFESLGVTKQPTCNTAGEQTLVCDCGESQAIYIPKTGEHIFKNGTCTLCGEADILLYESISHYDADGDGQKDVYYFSTELNNAAREGIHLWAGNYNAALSTFESPLTVGGHQHFYVSANSDQQIVYYVTVPEAGVYEMILHMRLKDGAERGAKYFINEGTDHEQIFETSHAFDEQTLALVRNETVGTYMYGIRVNRHGMAVCPFHNDKNPSMKVDMRFHCFACQADGDAVDFVSRLFGLPSKEAAMKLADDFGICYDSRQKPSVRPKIREPTPEQRYQQEENRCYKVLTDYFHSLRAWKQQYAPKQPEDEWHPLFVEALQRESYIEYLLDILLYGTPEEKKALVAEQRKEVMKLERRFAERTTDNDRGRSQRKSGLDR